MAGVTDVTITDQTNSARSTMVLSAHWPNRCSRKSPLWRVWGVRWFFQQSLAGLDQYTPGFGQWVVGLAEPHNRWLLVCVASWLHLINSLLQVIVGRLELFQLALSLTQLKHTTRNSQQWGMHVQGHHLDSWEALSHTTIKAQRLFTQYLK